MKDLFAALCRLREIKGRARSAQPGQLVNPRASGKQINWDPITEHDQRYFKVQASNTRGLGRKKIMKDMDCTYPGESETLS